MISFREGRMAKSFVRGKNKLYQTFRNLFPTFLLCPAPFEPMEEEKELPEFA